VSEAPTPLSETSDPGPLRWDEIAAAELSNQVRDYAPRYCALATAATAGGRAEDAALATLFGRACSFALQIDVMPRYAP